MTRWLSSDLHINHSNIVNLCNRPFGGINHMDQELIYRWNMKVGDEDEVYVLGDFTLNTRAMEWALPQLSGKSKYLISGNHDTCHSSKHFKHLDRYKAAGFIILDEQVKLTLSNGLEVLMCHFPYTGDSIAGQQ